MDKKEYRKNAIHRIQTKSGRVTKEQNKGGKRHKRRIAIEDGSESGVKLTDLPDLALEKIFYHMDSFKEVDTARTLTGPVEQACTNVLRSAYRQLEMDLVQDISVVRQYFVTLFAKMQSDTTPVPANSLQAKIAMHNASDSILQLETIYSSFVLVKAAVWGHATAGFHASYDGDLLDSASRIRAEIMASASFEPAPKQAVVRCRRAAAKCIARFADRLARTRFSAEEGRSVDVLAGISLLETLLCSFDSYNSVPHVTRFAGCGETGLVGLSVVYSLHNCWMGIEATDAYRAKAPEVRVKDAIQVIRELVWNSNNEIHLYDWQERKKLISDYQFEWYVTENPVHLRSGIQLNPMTYVDVIRDASYFGRTFNVVDANDDRILHYGNRSRVQGPSIIGSLFQQQQQVMIGSDIVKVPPAFRDGVLDVAIELTCHEELLPRYLCAMCTTSSVGRTLAELAPSFCLEISSHEDGEPALSRAYRFDVGAGS